MQGGLKLDAKSWAMLILLSVFWGGSFLFVEVALEQLPPVSIAATRVSIAAIVSVVLLKMGSHVWPKGARLWRAFVVMGITNNAIPFLLIAWGQQYTLGGVAAILNASTPIFTVIIAQIFTHDEKLTAAKVWGLTVAMVGVVMVIGTDALTQFTATNLGQIAILLAGVSYAVASVYGRRFAREGVAPLTVTTGQLIVSALILAPCAFFFDPNLLQHSPTIRLIGALIGLSVISTALAYLLYFRIIARAGATNATLVTVLVPASASLLTWAVLGEKLPVEAFIGMGVIAMGLLILDGRLLQSAKRLLGNNLNR